MKKQKYILLALSLLLGQSAFAHSKAFTPEFVDTLVVPYLHIQEKLAGDDLDHSKAAAGVLLTALSEGPQTEDAQATMTSLTKSVSQLKQAGDFKAARAAFSQLSAELQLLVEHVGTADAPELFVAHCPMALNGQGGSWLQDHTTVANPYYGAMMLRCGTVKDAAIQAKH